MKDFINKAISKLRYLNPYGANGCVKIAYSDLYEALRTLHNVGLINDSEFAQIKDCDSEMYREYFRTRKQNAE